MYLKYIVILTFFICANQTIQAGQKEQLARRKEIFEQKRSERNNARENRLEHLEFKKLPKKIENCQNYLHAQADALVCCFGKNPDSDFLSKITEFEKKHRQFSRSTRYKLIDKLCIFYAEENQEFRQRYEENSMDELSLPENITKKQKAAYIHAIYAPASIKPEPLSDHICKSIEEYKKNKK